MAAPQWNTIFRKSASFVGMTRILDEAGVTWDVESGGKHPKLVFEFGGRQHKHIISTSPSDPEAYRLAERDIRRIIASSPLENSAETVDDMPPTGACVSALPLLFEEQSVRLIDEDGTLWFVAADAAKPLGYRMASDATRLLDSDEKGTRLVRTLGGTQSVSVISEAGLYKLIARSDKPGAKRFDRWVRHDVLPSIRKHGTYATDPALMREIEKLRADVLDIRAAADLAMEAASRIEAAKVAPTVDLASTITSDDLISLAGIKPGQRVRGTSAMVTGRMLTFTAGHGCFKTPAHLNPSMPWRFPREKGHEWLFGAQLGAEQIRNQIERQRRKRAQRARPSQQGHLTLVGAP